MTTVTNVVLDDAGRPASNIQVQIVLQTSAGKTVTSAFSGPTEINPRTTTYTDVEGFWTLNLFGNDSITPAGTRYQVTHVISTGNQVTNFVVPTASGTHTLASLVV